VKWASIKVADAVLAGDGKWDAVEAPDRERDDAGVHGSHVHEALEAIWHGRPMVLPADGERAWDVAQAVRRVSDYFASRPELVVLATEWRIEGRLTGGTVDWLCLNTQSAELEIGDLKTGSRAGRASESWAVQLGGYRRLVELELGGTVGQCFALHVPRRDPSARARAYNLHGAWLDASSRSYRHLTAAWYELEPVRTQLGLRTRYDEKAREVRKHRRKDTDQ
jgi:hypothetical protein